MNRNTMSQFLFVIIHKQINLKLKIYIFETGKTKKQNQATFFDVLTWICNQSELHFNRGLVYVETVDHLVFYGIYGGVSGEKFGEPCVIRGEGRTTDHLTAALDWTESAVSRLRHCRRRLHSHPGHLRLLHCHHRLHHLCCNTHCHHPTITGKKKRKKRRKIAKHYCAVLKVFP